MASAIRTKVREVFGVDEKVADMLLKTAGAKAKRVGAGIFLMFMYPDAVAYKAVRLVEAAA